MHVRSIEMLRIVVKNQYIQTCTSTALNSGSHQTQRHSCRSPRRASMTDLFTNEFITHRLTQSLFALSDKALLKLDKYLAKNLNGLL